MTSTQCKISDSKSIEEIERKEKLLIEHTVQLPLLIQDAREEGYYQPLTEKLALVTDTARRHEKKNGIQDSLHNYVPLAE